MARALLIAVVITVLAPPVGIALLAAIGLVALSRELNGGGGPITRAKYDRWAQQEPYWTPELDRKS
jgi:hypothetical protein